MKRLLTTCALLLAASTASAQTNAWERPRLTDFAADTDSISVRMISLKDSLFKYSVADSVIYSVVKAARAQINQAFLEAWAGGIDLIEVNESVTWPQRHQFDGGASFPFEAGAGIAQIVDGGANPDTLRWNWSVASNYGTVTLDEDTFVENPSGLDEGWASMRICQPAGGNLALVGYGTAFGTAADIHEGASQCTTLHFESYNGVNLTVHSSRGEKCEPVVIGAKDAELAVTDSTGFHVPAEWTLTNLYAGVKVAPTGAAINLDVQDGPTTSLLSGTWSIAAGQVTAAAATFATDHTVASMTNQLIIDVTQVGSTEPGEELTVWVCYVQ